MKVVRAHAFALVAVVVALGVVAATPRRAEACASCGCGDPTLTATGVERPYKNRVRIAWEERYGSLTMGNDLTGEHTQYLRSTAAASWSPWRRFTLALTLPWVTSWIQRASIPRATVNGLGDMELAGARGALPGEVVRAAPRDLGRAAGSSFRRDRASPTRAASRSPTTISPARARGIRSPGSPMPGSPAS